MEVIRLFSQQNDNLNNRLIKGIGDDCAVFAPGTDCDWMISTDMLVEGVHFDSSWHPPYYLGRKCMAASLSDIAAMGGCPQFALVAIGLPQNMDREQVRSLSSGVNAMLTEFDCQLIGGDTVKGAELTLTVTIIGTVGKDQAILRNTASVGDTVYVSGNLGSAAAGLLVCQGNREMSPSEEELARPFIKRHLDPLPDVACGLQLAGSGLVSSMQDLSDGLATDLAHICQQSNVGADIDAALLPCEDNFLTVCDFLEQDGLSLQISGGEDYHLVFTVKSGREREFEDIVADKMIREIHRIGQIISGSGVHLLNGAARQEVSFQGYSHRA